MIMYAIELEPGKFLSNSPGFNYTYTLEDARLYLSESFAKRKLDTMGLLYLYPECCIIMVDEITTVDEEGIDDTRTVTRRN